MGGAANRADCYDAPLASIPVIGEYLGSVPLSATSAGAVMSRLWIGPRDITVAVVIFIVLVLGFVGLSKAVGWPNAKEGWSLAIIIAGIIAAVPVGSHVLTFFKESRATVGLPGGFTFDFSRVAVEQPVQRLPDNVVQPGIALDDSTQQMLDQAAATASEQSIIVVDLRDGRAWYLTRLFALAATGAVMRSPRAVVLVCQRNGRPQQVLGWARPDDIVTGITRHDVRYRELWQYAMRYLENLRLNSGPQIAPVAELPKLAWYNDFYRKIGALVIMRIIVDQARHPDAPHPPGAAAPLPPPPPLESDDDPPWVSAADAETMLDPWLVRETVDMSKPPQAQIEAILSVHNEIILAVRATDFLGIVDVHRVERQILRQLAAQPGDKHSEGKSV